MFLELITFLLGKLTFFAGSVINGSCFPRPLSKEEEQECLKRVAEGDKEAKDKLITHNLRLVAHMVKKYSGSADNDDLLSVGSIGLIKAVSTYELNKGTSFATYTARCIENEILMLLRASKKHKGEISLNDSIGKDKEGNDLELIDMLADSGEEIFEKVDKKIGKEKLLALLKKTLTDREYKVIVLRYGLKGGRAYAQREVAGFLKISRSYISRIENKAIEKLGKTLKKSQFYC